MRNKIAIACLIALLAGCETGRLSGQAGSGIDRDVGICTPPSTRGDPMMVMGTLPQKKRENEYRKCMEEKGHTDIPAMPKGFGEDPRD